MPTPNFRTMDHFPLYARDFICTISYCPSCGTYQNSGSPQCESCNEKVERREFYDYHFADAICTKVRDRLTDANRKLLFHEITLESGYYSGVQFYVENRPDPTDLDNETCHYYFNMCRSESLRKYKVESKRVDKILRMLADEFNFEELRCVEVFSNGEAIYERVGSYPAMLS